MNTHFNKTMQFVQELRYSLIMAVDSRGGMGLNNGLPWKAVGAYNKTDMAWYRKHTLGKIIVMGYNTWVSIGRKPLPDRYNVIITTKHKDEVNADIKAWGDIYYKTEKGQQSPIHSMVAPSPKVAMDTLQATLGEHHRGGEVMVIGGAQIYEAFMVETSRIYLTTFNGEFEADAFVNLDLKDWKLRYLDTLSCLKPKFGIWDCTAEAAKHPDSEIINISYGHKPAAGMVKEIMEEMGK